jgi:type I restriction enzyme R subunit
MKPTTLNEAVVEAMALDCLESLGYASLRGGEIVPDSPQSEREPYAETVLGERLRTALRKLNPALPTEALDEAFRKVTVLHGGQVGDKRVGVVWHTQGSGKSLTMAFYAGRLVLEPAMENPTLVVLTDRNDPDDQLSAELLCADWAG